MTITLGEFPHTCPGAGCAICRWVAEKQWEKRVLQVLGPETEAERVERQAHEVVEQATHVD